MAKQSNILSGWRRVLNLNRFIPCTTKKQFFSTLVTQWPVFKGQIQEFSRGCKHFLKRKAAASGRSHTVRHPASAKIRGDVPWVPPSRPCLNMSPNDLHLSFSFPQTFKPCLTKPFFITPFTTRMVTTFASVKWVLKTSIQSATQGSRNFEIKTRAEIFKWSEVGGRRAQICSKVAEKKRQICKNGGGNPPSPTGFPPLIKDNTVF